MGTASYNPSLKAKVVGGIQWMLTGYYVFVVLTSIAFYYLEVYRPDLQVDVNGTAVFAGIFIAGFGAGYLWVRLFTPSEDAERARHLRRIEYLLLLVVAGFVVPILVYVILDVFSSSVFELPFGLLSVVTTLPPLLLAIVVEYVLDIHPLLDIAPE